MRVLASREDSFGERSLLYSEPTNARISVWRMTSQKALVCYALDRASFHALLGTASEAQAVLTQLVHSRESGLASLVRFSDLHVRRILGIGTFGRVKLAVRQWRSSSPPSHLPAPLLTSRVRSFSRAV